TSGLEWNLKITEKDSFDIVKKFEATFESYWNDSEFNFFTNSDENKKILSEALEGEFNKNSSENSFFMDIRPYAYQKEVLESLKAEREIFNRHKNLVVAATGVGKTVISAFDYKNFVSENRNKVNRLLFVAHREEILKQSRDTFRAILRDNNFGELMVGSNISKSLDHLFVSIQSLNSKDLTSITSKDFYDFIIVDEFHHAAAPSYQKLLSYYEPKILLGLTATPERNDGEDVFKYFKGRISAEIRLNEAIDRKLLSPFQYFAVTDSIDLSKLKWSRKGYDIRELDNLYTNNDIRSSHILDSVNKYVTNIKEVVGLGFCVSIEHAKYMANFFTKQGVESIALHGKSTLEERNTAKERLVKGSIKFIFVVDLYNEGVDIPEVNTILFLRPTESLTVFLQQLGRGLRLSHNKDCLTVLDYVGQAHKNYNFEEKFRSITGASNHSIKYYLENGFIHLPKGCYIQLEKQAKEYILRNLKESVNNKTNLINKLKTFTSDTSLELTLGNFLKHHHLTLIEFYGKSGSRNFSRMCVEAGVLKDFKEKNEVDITKKLKNLFHLNSRRLIKFIIFLISNKNFDFSEEESLIANILYYTFYNNNPEKEGFKSIREALEELFNNQVMMKEVVEILKFNYNNLHFIDKEINLGFNCPLDLHCNYTRDQIMAAFGYFNEHKKPAFREGVKYFEDKKLDAFFITLNKSDKDFSPSTLYEDYAINEELF
ncbi:MAG: DEAD/DEAH box helicase family protein, partial [Sarcina sp.]